ncbi:hypothetical protein CXG81DRAFT_16075 [Caulochytrium protostelioides]|uniref:Cupredoxin n=1 Tax=Caulochytrium protostelioides TaxID=1555241 RepID=A0A4P9X082_9FUNG|nr:Cupredoxin [Caulochytrium protostelioides]RKO98321.1 hypothetical protein CXG81DRAFT_16075 [Caulochytrium protostelioides]|eukprot:RKO98321.1 hypothetical protein CXG81DRAFT_16075 [Caulochytrium protostelioides]
MNVPVLNQNAPTKYFDFDVSEDYGAPDCVEKVIRLINNEWPPKPMHVNTGDNVVITVRNKLFTESLTVHIHGLLFKGAPWADGAPHITQEPLPPGKEQVLSFNVGDQVGTYFAHAHNNLQELSVYTPFIVHDDNMEMQALGYHDERIITLSDNYHRDTDALMAGLRGPQYRWTGDAQSLLTNGIGSFQGPCSIRPDGQPYPSSWSITEVQPGRTYRLRIINAAALGYFQFQISGHRMVVVEADGMLIEPFEIEALTINSGQRYSVLLTTDQPPQDYWVNHQIIWRRTGPQNGWSLLRYTSANIPFGAIPVVPSVLPPRLPEVPDYMERFLLPRLNDPRGVVPPATRQLMFRFRSQASPATESRVRWTFNERDWRDPVNTIMLMQKLGQLRTPQDAAHGQVVHLRRGEVIDVIMQGQTNQMGVCEDHPIHLHGHGFWDLGSGPGTFINEQAPPVPSVAVFRDTTTVYAYSNLNAAAAAPPGTDCGWRRFRFVADNPGAWLLHCHIPAHLVNGMAAAFLEIPEDIPAPPSDINNWRPISF